MLRGTNLKYTKAYNHRIVLETIRLHGPLARADIARSTELTAQTVSNIVSKLIDENKVKEASKRREGRGAPSTLLKLNAQAAYAIGLDLDRDHVTGVLMDLSGSVLQRYHRELDFPSPEEAVVLMSDVAHQLTDDEGLSADQINGIGIGFPGPIEITEHNRILNTVNPKAFPGWEHVPLVDMLEEHLSPPIFLENNATAAAIGERWYGSGQQVSSFFYVYFGSGLGGGIVLDGQPYEGFSGNAGELGYIPDNAQPDDAHHHSGEHFNLPSLYQALREEGYEASTPQDLGNLFEQRNEHLLSWMDQGIRVLAPLIRSVEYLIDPEVIFFGGRLPVRMIGAIMDQMSDKLNDTRTRIEGKSFAPDLRQGAAGADAAALGVATLPMYELFAPSPQLLIKDGREHTPQ